MKLLKFVISIVSLIIIFFVRWQLFLFPAPKPMPDLPTSDWSTVPFYYPNFYHPSSCCGVGGNEYQAGWSFSVFFILLILWILVNLILFLIINKVSNKTNPKNI